METYLTKNERVIAFIAIPVIAAFFALFVFVNRGPKSTAQLDTGVSINYEMGRAEQAYSEYNLDGREWDQSYEALAQKARKAKAKKEKIDKKKADLIAKQTAEAKKLAEIKKRRDAAARAQKSRQQTEKLQVQNAVRENLKTAAAQQAADAIPQENSSYNNAAYTAPAADRVVDPAADDGDTNENGKKSFGEWQALLLASPTAENLAAFVAAYRKNEVTAEEFQGMAQDLLSQRDLRYKALGLMALRSVPSLASLSQLVHLDPSSVGSYQSYVEQSINGYLQNQNLSYLNQALQTQDRVLVVRVLKLLNDNLLKLSEGDTSVITDPRNRRDSSVAAFSMNDYFVLVPNLTRLAGSQDQDLAAMAQNASSLIQSYNNIARN